MALLFVLLIHQNHLVRYLGYALCFAGSLLVPDPGHVHFPFYAPLFLFGIIIFLRMAPLISHIEFWILFIFCFVFNYFYCEAVSSFLGGTTALVILFFNKIKIPVLNALGKVSYSTYLVHPILGAAVINILSHRSTELWQKWLIVGLGIVVTIISSYMMYWLVEKPSKKLASSIKLDS
jgi:peptidoglycan/LPS O-acetylase OafA/YrhL